MLTDEQVIDAVNQMIAHTKLSMEKYRQGVGEYETVSARGVLHTLGFEEEDTDQVLTAIGEAGFWYCLDPSVPDKNDDHRFPQHACYWGADQLESRLQSIPHMIEFYARQARRAK